MVNGCGKGRKEPPWRPPGVHDVRGQKADGFGSARRGGEVVFDLSIVGLVHRDDVFGRRE